MNKKELFVYCLASGAMVSSVVCGVVLMKLLPLAANDTYLYEDVAIFCLVIWALCFFVSVNWLFRWAVRFSNYMRGASEGVKETRGGLRKVAFFANGKPQKPIRVNKKRSKSVG